MFSLSALGFSLVTVFMTLIMTKRLSALVALILVPSAFALGAGFGATMGPMMLDGIKTLAPTGAMLMFAILYFSVMNDAGMFDPLIRKLVQVVHGDPLRVAMGTALLALLVGLDGDSSTTYLIVIAAMWPLYKQLGMDPRVLAALAIMAAGITNVAPWGGPTARAASALALQPKDLFLPLLPALAACVAWLFCTAWWLGRQERARLGVSATEPAGTGPEAYTDPRDEADAALKRPRLRPLNLLLTAALIAGLVQGWLPLPVLFMGAFAIALLINYPALEDQKARIAAHAGNVLAVVSLIFAAGIFTGIMQGTKMIDTMAESVIAALPASWGAFMPLIAAGLSVPGTFFISNDAFYFGVLPILAKAGAAYGFAPVEIARASLIGQQVHLLSPLVASTYLLVGLVDLDLGDHQRFTLKWALAACLVMLVSALLTGGMPLTGRGA
jgi:CitMHS family citrate-Mg2+:H+ or citrate-Ca2+:H+ symporter